MTNPMNNLNDLAILNGESEGPDDGFAAPLGIDGKQPPSSTQEALAKLSLVANSGHVEELLPDLVNALLELFVHYR
jgi:hypothetical protein